ncbi:unnamed protein product [Schistosoma curassoni]|uniref:TNF receptor-associated factor 3 n=1 Tax=Schistosoma curassoni TaxID=6186 RepID=A0A183KSB7_9TREM|nr:unnamed protein product [Schistosoma curassoni]
MVAVDQRLSHTPLFSAGFWSPCASLVWGPAKAPDIRLSRNSESISQVNSVASSEPVIIEKKKRSLPTVEEVKDMTEKRDHVPVMNVDFYELPNVVRDVESTVESAKTKLKEFEHVIEKYLDALLIALISKEKNWGFVGKLELKKDMLEEQVEKIVQQALQQLDELHHIIEQHKNSEQAIDSNIIPDSIESYGKLQYDLTGSINKNTSLCRFYSVNLPQVYATEKRLVNNDDVSGLGV